MTKLKTFAILAASTVALGGATVTAAQAQPWRHAYSDPRLTTSYVDGLDWKITNAAQRGVISWGEARGLRAQLRTVQPLAYRVQVGTAGPGETRHLENVVDRIDSAVNGD